MSTFPTTEILPPAELHPHADPHERAPATGMPAPSRARAWGCIALAVAIAGAGAVALALSTPVPAPVRAMEALTVMILVGGVALALIARLDAALTRGR
jgi:hypothetical protein